MVAQETHINAPNELHSTTSTTLESAWMLRRTRGKVPFLRILVWKLSQEISEIIPKSRKIWPNLQKLFLNSQKLNRKSGSTAPFPRLWRLREWVVAQVEMAKFFRTWVANFHQNLWLIILETQIWSSYAASFRRKPRQRHVALWSPILALRALSRLESSRLWSAVLPIFD